MVEIDPADDDLGVFHKFPHAHVATRYIYSYILRDPHTEPNGAQRFKDAGFVQNIESITNILQKIGFHICSENFGNFADPSILSIMLVPLLKGWQNISSFKM